MNEIAHFMVLPFSIFVFGMWLQAFYMLWGRWEKGDGSKLLFSLGYGLLGMLPGKNERDYSLPLHLFLSCVAMAFAFVYNFRKKLLVRVDGQMLLVWNALFLIMLSSRLDFGIWWPLFAVIAIPSAVTLLNGFSDIDRSFGWQVFFYVWFSIIVVTIGIFHFAFGTLGVFQGNIPQTISLFDILLAGSSFLYLLVNAWYVLALIPIPLQKHQTFASRMIEVKNQMQLLAHGYIWKKDNVAESLILVIVLPLLFTLNHFFQFTSESSLISIAFVIVGVIGGHENMGLDDGVGEAV